jgi:hypothetical protein
MITDERLEFCDAVACNTGAADTYNIGDIINMEDVRDLGNGQPVYLVMTCDTSIITGGSAGTVAFQLVSDSTDTIATDGSQTIHITSEAFVTDDAALNDLDAGDIIWCVALPTEGPAYEQYLALQQVTGTTAITAGKVNAFLTLTPHAAPKAYADGI